MQHGENDIGKKYGKQGFFPSASTYEKQSVKLITQFRFWISPERIVDIADNFIPRSYTG